MAVHHHEYIIRRGNIFTPTFYITTALIILAVLIVMYRYWMGMGYITNMSDGYPWGTWKSVNVSLGAAFACGGYVLAILVYIFNKYKYHHMVRSGVLVSMFGYSLAGLAVMIDIGRPWNAIYFFVPSNWQLNSALFEVALCVMAYTGVTMLEFLPAVFERTSLIEKYPRFSAFSKKWYHVLEKITFLIIAIGVTLPSMHQSSLGTMLISTGHKLHPLWQSNFIPLLFLITAFIMGIASIILVSMLTSKLLHRPFEKSIYGISKLIPYATITWIVVRVISLTTSGAWGYLFTSGLNSVFVILEFLTIGIPAYIILATKLGKSKRGVFICSCLMIAGVCLYRLGVYLLGFNVEAGWNRYFPSFGETLTTTALLLVILWGYVILIKLVPVLPNLNVKGDPRKD